jgi:hypothetical protein
VRKILFILTTLIAIFFSFQANCQIKVKRDSLIKDIKGNIIFVGIEHSDNLYEEIKDRKGYQKSSLISDSSGMYLCSIYPEIIKASKGKHIAFMMEALRPKNAIVLDSSSTRALKFPECLEGNIIYGCDTRPDSIKIQTAIVFGILDRIYNDGLTGKEKTFEEAFGEYSTVDLRKIKPDDIEYFNYWSKVAGVYNRNFENYILGIARGLEQKGYYVVVLCGAAHASKIIAEEQKKDIGYVICMNPKSIQSTFRTAKLLMVLEMLAYKK